MRRLDTLIPLAVAVLLFAVPILVFAQVAAPGTAPGAGAPPVATFHGFDLTPVVTAIIGLVGAALTWLVNRIRTSAEAANAAAAAKSKAEVATIRLAAIAATLVGKAWDQLAPELQRVLADGQISEVERDELEQDALALLHDAASEDDLKQIADALGLPLAGLAAKVAAHFIDTWTKAHDPSIPTVSEKAYPVGSDAG